MSYNENTITFAEHPTDRRFVDRTGSRYTRLTVIGYAGKKGRRHFWYCRCDCGAMRSVVLDNLQAGHTQSCGCLQRTAGGAARTIHGESHKTPEYAAYTGARSRCNNPNETRYADWGGRGIEFRFNSYQEFLAEVGRKPSSKHSLNRIDNNGHYESGNVEWAMPLKQNNNTRANRYLTYDGLTLTVTEWARKLNVPPSRIQLRLTRRGYCVACALTLPVDPTCKQRCPHPSTMGSAAPEVVIVLE